MKEFKSQDGKIVHLPDSQQRATTHDECDCHTRMGNDFYFLPLSACLRPDKKCNCPSKPS